MVKRQCLREFLLIKRDPRQILYSCLFFLMILIFFPLTVSSDMKMLRLMAPGIVWISIVFVCFLSSERLFQQDYEEGVLEQWLLSGHSIFIYLLPKIFIHWLMLLIPLLCICPVVGLLLQFNGYEVMVLMLIIALGTPALIFLCALTAAFSSGGVKQKGVLMALVLLPLSIPIMILGSTTLALSLQMLPILPYVLLLAALALIGTALLPFAIGAVVRVCLADG